MSKFAYFSPVDFRVLQWIDTDAMSYNLPPAELLHQCTDAEWALQDQGDTMMLGNKVVPYVAPEVTEGQSLADARGVSVSRVSAACAATLVSGFTSSALGVALTYPSQDNDQRNLQSAVSAAATASPGWTIPLWCTDGDHWSFTSHTAAQLQQVNADWLAHRVAAQQKYADLIAQINAATSVEEVQAIHW